MIDYEKLKLAHELTERVKIHRGWFYHYNGFLVREKSPIIFIKRKSRLAGSGCIEWIGALNNDGYGSVRTFNWGRIYKVSSAHQLSYVVHYGDYDRNLCVCHSCDNPKCINPEHLWLGTRKQNTGDMFSKKRGRRDGEHHPSSKITLKLSNEIQEMAKIKSTKELCRTYNLSKAVINAIKRGDHWTCKQNSKASARELTEPKPKYEVGQNVFWLDERAGGHIFHGVINAICRNQSDTMYGYDIDHLNYAEYKEMFPMAVSSSRWQLWDDDKLYPTKQALIESQITYWQSLLEPKECQHLWVRGKCYDCGIDKECQHESDRESFVKENGVPPGLTARFKCKKCGEFYK